MEARVRRTIDRYCTKWLNRDKKIFNARSLDLRDAKVKYINQGSWKAFVNDVIGGMTL